LPRPQRWTLDVAASGEPRSWHDPAQRLVAVLREISNAVRDGYGRPLTWRTPGDGPETWADIDLVRRAMERTAKLDSGARGLVHGHLAENDPAIVDLLWRAGSDGRVLDCTARFNPRGGARSLSRHDPEWLVALLGFTVDVVGGNAGRIVTSSWLKEDERRAGAVPFWLGEVTYVPGAVDPATLPATLVAHPWPTSHGMGTVVALVDLSATITASGPAVNDMLALRRYLPS
jgi:hypothetical protein